MQEKGFAQILVLIGIIVVIIGGGVYFYLRKEINTNPNNSLNTAQALINKSPDTTPTPSQTPQTSAKEVSSTPASPVPISGDRLLYTDNECNLEIVYPRKTVDGRKEYLWTLDATSKRMAITYAGRTGPNLNQMDHSITIFAQPLGSNSIFYSASADIVCTKNEDNLSLESFKEKFLLAGKESQPTVLEATKIGGVKFIPIIWDTKTEYGDQTYPTYIGVYNNFLIEVMNSNPGSGKLQEDAKSILNNIKFTNSNSN
ncbi:hypothetical protein A3J19_02060 [Candidatus Daviesbacteria bacterium RIFCSPLOWO2_02_FULL_41_8]|uniref:Uncharacterized protein n=3 Tax=Candidatus Daviesiibacteriota TaxID=1752718 RepID=A0A1F5NIG1_9BACT|nr:MAG: hypothetical protein A2871_03185 [Candidatus Daviesbacteria bacterium RIFCSPHIGHO2_01_FULL_41_23]OGE32414.1 MAG: hypothetical protein A3D83_02030 [Candidatus Daviesbacteria bacterium RIFCSPHIGHO2_02_FULL_41_10]OGE61933.1 MAG: hypothetical protein A2967_03000 [Candidatus Daviesbacteria bacterium RIFCSPLOWO2_01_FULL_41_32]OGE77408.1 MAG: hypothetical protein A3J19_02060 [Candidatus Daviesbacteria bacterium RIFCSPLOWO2_02_FULL_41_8]